MRVPITSNDRQLPNAQDEPHRRRKAMNETDVIEQLEAVETTKRGGVGSGDLLGFPPILDACCGGRQFWFDKENPNVLFADCRVMPDKVVGTGKDARTRRCLPDRVHDFRAMDYPDETFQMVVFDPPHLFLGENSFMAQSYGRLEKETWRDDLSKGFAECFRVLKVGGVLIFKWNECDIPLSEVLKCTTNQPLFGHPSGKAQKTHWCAFWKPNAKLTDRCPTANSQMKGKTHE